MPGWGSYFVKKYRKEITAKNERKQKSCRKNQMKLSEKERDYGKK